MEEFLKQSPTSWVAWIGLLFFAVKDIYFWVKNRGIPSYEETIKKVDQILTKLETIAQCHENLSKTLKCSEDKSEKNRDELFDSLEAVTDVVEKLSKIVSELHQWHSITTEDGVKIWYIRPTLERALQGLKEAIDIQTNLTKELVQELKHNTVLLSRVETRVEALPEIKSKLDSLSKK